MIRNRFSNKQIIFLIHVAQLGVLGYAWGKKTKQSAYTSHKTGKDNI